MKDLTSNEDPFEDRALLMVLPSENSRPSSEKSHLFLKPCSTISIDGCEAVLPPQNLPESPPDVKTLSLSVSFHGYRFANINFKSWARKMSALHKPTWEKAGILEAVMASTKRIYKNKDLVLGIAEKWCSDSKTFVFPWGETTITLEDVMVLLGFSVLGSPVFATLDSSGEKIKEKVETEWVKIRREKLGFVGQVRWMKRFMNSDDDELEHVAFLVLWLSYFVFPSCYYHIHRGILPIAVHLSRGNRLALAPVVLAHLYEDLTLLKNHIGDFKEARETDTIDLSSLFKLVQVWTWERFRELQPTPKPLLKGEPRLARWNDLKQESTSNVRQILESWNMDSFDWRPYTKAMENWEFPKFYPEEAMWVSVGPNLDGEFISFARCIKVSPLVGFDCVEHYFPDRVASQFGMLQDVPAPVNRNNLSPEAAWKEYDKPIDDLALYIPSRYAKPRPTPMYCEWWRSSYPEFQYSSEQKQVVESAKTLKLGNITGDDETSNCVRTSSKISRTSGVGIEIMADSTNERRQCMKQARDKRREYMKRVREEGENNIGRCQTQVPSDDDEEGYASEPVAKKSRFEVDSNDLGLHQKLASVTADGEEAVPPPEIEQVDEETYETRSNEAVKPMVLSPYVETNSSDPPVGIDGAIDIVVSPPETRQCCDNELDVCGSNVEKMTMIDDGSKEPECFLHEDGAIDEQASKADNNESNRNNLSQGWMKSRNIIGADTSNFVHSGSEMSRTSEVGIKIAEDSTNKRRKCMKQARDKRREYLKRVREEGEDIIGRYQTQIASENDEYDASSFVPTGSKMKRRSEDGMKMAKDLKEKRRQDMKLARVRRRKYIKLAREKTRKYIERVRSMVRDQTHVPSNNDEEDDSGADASEPVGKKTRLEADNNDSGTHQKVASLIANGDEAVPPADIEQRNEETEKTRRKAGKRMVLSPYDETNSSDPPFDGAIDIVVSQPKTRQSYDNELDVCGSNAEKMTMIDGSSKEAECFLHEDGAVAEEEAHSGEKEDDDDDIMIQKRLAPCQNLAPGGANGDETCKAYKRMVPSPSDELNIHIAVGDGTQGQDCLVHDNGLGTKETMKSNGQLEDLEKRNDDFGEGGAGDDSYEKNLHQLKVLTSSIEERINRASRNVEWLKARKAMKQTTIAAARLSR